MIERITIQKVASCFDDTGIEINNLEKVNYIYGANGSGKTSISRIIKNPDSFPHCNVDWKDGTEIKTYVYNKQFVEENFHRNKDLKGIFTLGSESYEIQENIKTKKDEIDKLKNDIKHLAEKLNTKTEEVEKNELDYETNCWKLKLKYQAEFKQAFEGFMGSKRVFKEKCKMESGNTSSLSTLTELISRSETVFGSNKEILSEINIINYTDLEKLESASILQKRIIGREDIDIAELINRLNISDWVKKGFEYYKESDGTCPFCQRATEMDFAKQLEEYFDDTYINNISKVKMLTEKYNKVMEGIIEQLEFLLNIENEFININSIKQQKDLIIAMYQNNKMLLDKKVREPSLIIELDKYTDYFSIINEEINSANVEIRRHNELVRNIKEEEEKLISSVWRYIFEENKDDYKRYYDCNNNIQKEIDSMNNAKNNKEERISKLNDEIIELEAMVTSVKHTVNEINKILTSFGFISFKLVEAAEHGYYRIVRENGEYATETLSEGETTFISFLYFYHLLKGSNNQETITSDRIVVFDDPISSLDSNILFIVSNLIKGIINDINESKGYIKQIFILTHNIYFHKEVSFRNNRDSNPKSSNETFWILSKRGKISKIESYDYNPIKTSYELLWEEVKEGNPSTIQNTMRRIIEYYFKILGQQKDKDLINKFEPEEMDIYKTLITWLHDGSHSVYEDLYVDLNTEDVERYNKVFKRVFEVTDNIGHYNMMMGLN